MDHIKGALAFVLIFANDFVTGDDDDIYGSDETDEDTVDHTSGFSTSTILIVSGASATSFMIGILIALILANKIKGVSLSDVDSSTNEKKNLSIIISKYNPPSAPEQDEFLEQIVKTASRANIRNVDNTAENHYRYQPSYGSSLLPKPQTSTINANKPYSGHGAQPPPQNYQQFQPPPTSIPQPLGYKSSSQQMAPPPTMHGHPAPPTRQVASSHHIQQAQPTLMTHPKHPVHPGHQAQPAQTGLRPVTSYSRL